MLYGLYFGISYALTFFYCVVVGIDYATETQYYSKKTEILKKRAQRAWLCLLPFGWLGLPLLIFWLSRMLIQNITAWWTYAFSDVEESNDMFAYVYKGLFIKKPGEEHPELKSESVKWDKPR